MKRIAFFLVLALLVAMAPVAFAQAQGQEQGQKGKRHQEEVEVVSVDATAKTITFKPAGKKDQGAQAGQTAQSGAEKTATVEGSAAAMLGELKPGDRVTVTCSDDANGQHKSIVAIKKPEKKY